jgi:D-arabinose 1-dehydrogenase-like Zn-dependent alcohol dehydrogenase
MAGVNPVDLESVHANDAMPMPHVPGTEFAGLVQKIGRNVKNMKKGDRVTVYSRIYCGKCRLCKTSKEMMCINSGNKMIGWDTNGGYAEYVAVPKENVFKIPDSMGWEMAASLPIAALTGYHTIKEARLKKNENLVLFGASGNTGMFISQFANEDGANVFAISDKSWLTKGFGAYKLIGRDRVGIEMNKLRDGKLADVIIDPIGAESLDTSMSISNYCSRIFVFGGLKSHEAKIDIQKLYRKEISIIGVTGGSINEFLELIKKAHGYKVRVWKTFRLEEGKEALKALSSKDRNGRVMLKIG